MKVLLGCEESQAVCKEFRARGHEAYSCDLKPCSGGHPEWHLQMDVFDAIESRDWDLGIFFPDCTYLTVSSNKWFKDQPKRKSGALVGAERREARRKAVDFFKRLYFSEIPKVALENPIGSISTMFMKPTQVIQPYFFGDPHPKSTCLWLRGLPPLFHAKEIDLFNKEVTHVEPEFIIGKRDGKKYSVIHYESVGKKPGERAEIRSKTFQGIARAMAEQWG